MGDRMAAIPFILIEIVDISVNTDDPKACRQP
jgi:hypothetical protein